MATFQDHLLGDQIIQNLARMVPNMRDNANDYKANISKDAATLSLIINGDISEFLRRIKWMEDLETRNLTAYTNALAARALTVTQADNLRGALKTAALNLQTASKTTQTEINTACDSFLSAIPNYERIF